MRHDTRYDREEDGLQSDIEYKHGMYTSSPRRVHTPALGMHSDVKRAVREWPVRHRPLPQDVIPIEHR